MSEKALTRYFQNASNKVLDILSEHEKGKGNENVWTDASFAERVGVSANLIQRVLVHLLGKGVVTKRDRRWRLARSLRKGDYFDLKSEELSGAETIDNYCIRQLSSGRFRPGDRISELRLAREANVATGSVRESLLRLSRFGVIQKNARRQWLVVEWSSPKIDQLIEWRLLVERHGLDKLLSAPVPATLDLLKALLTAHLGLSRSSKLSAEEFARLDEKLHSTILSASQNPFIEDAFRTIWFIIRFQFLHHAMEAEHIRLGCEQHIKLLRAILAGDVSGSRKLLADHLSTAAKTLKQLIAFA